ncbi:MAG TPA: OmpA family protein [Bryobacteraceae bacterium]|nr:OmpA family protein [Bryobacteraceae bacterium]
MNRSLCAMIGVACLVGVGCSKKVAVKPPPPAQAQEAKAASPEKPVISLFAANPSSIEKGGQATLRWAVEHANNVQISPALGSVNESGSRTIFPSSDTTYTLTATGPGGNASATTSVSITVRTASRMPDQATKNRIQELLDRIQDAYFDYDRHNIRPDAQTALAADAKTLGEILKQYPDYKLTVQGYCDERGSEQYNIALGDKRAEQAKDYLASLGVPGSQLKTVSFGKEKPVCTEHDEECWQKNRRAHITQEQ